MTETSRSFFVESHLPVLKKIAARRAQEIESLQDREDTIASFIAVAWEEYVSLTRLDPKPSLRWLLGALYRPVLVRGGGPEPDVKVLSIANPKVRLVVEAVPA